MKRIIALLISVLFCATVLVGQYRIDNVPNPKQEGQDFYVSDPDHILSQSTLDRLNQLSHEIDTASQAEFAIVVVKDYIGADAFTFALELFNNWGIGKEDSNNGLLLFVAIDQREWRFITGYGMESVFPDALLRRLGEQVIVPKFRETQYDEGLLETSQYIHQALLSADAKAELESLLPKQLSFWSLQNPYFKNSLLVIGLFALAIVWVSYTGRKLRGNAEHKKANIFLSAFTGCGCMVILMFLSLFIFLFVFDNLDKIYQIKNIPYFLFILGTLILTWHYSGTRSAIEKSYHDTENANEALERYKRLNIFLIPLAILALFEVFAINRRIRKTQLRLMPPDGSGEWERLNRDEIATRIDNFLNQGHLKEEEIKSRSYEVWRNTKTANIKLIAWDENDQYAVCTSCGYVTLETELNEAITAATYSSTGTERVYDKCQYCAHVIEQGTRTIPKLERSSSSSGSGGGSRSSGGGSFGGGRSGGGGAGGRW